jgi:hypothetical protein
MCIKQKNLKGVPSMKKVLVIVFALVIGVAFASAAFAQSEKAISSGAAASGQPQPPMKPGPKDTGAPSVEKAEGAVVSGAAKVSVFKGEVVKVDEAAKTFVVKDKKGEKTFTPINPADLANLKPGDKVSLQYGTKEGKVWADNIKKAGAKAAPKTPAAGISSGVSATGEPAPKPAPKPAAPAPAK